MNTEQPYMPTEDLIIEAWKRYSGAQDAKYARLSDGDAGDEARHFLARVRRDAWDEGRDALALALASPLGEDGMRRSPINPHREDPTR